MWKPFFLALRSETQKGETTAPHKFSNCSFLLPLSWLRNFLCVLRFRYDPEVSLTLFFCAASVCRCWLAVFVCHPKKKAETRSSNLPSGRGNFLNFVSLSKHAKRPRMAWNSLDAIHDECKWSCCVFAFYRENRRRGKQWIMLMLGLKIDLKNSLLRALLAFFFALNKQTTTRCEEILCLDALDFLILGAFCFSPF